MINDENILTPQKNQASDDDDDDDKNDDEMMVIFFSDHMWISRKMGVYLDEQAPSLHAHAGQVSSNILFAFAFSSPLSPLIVAIFLVYLVGWFILISTPD